MCHPASHRIHSPSHHFLAYLLGPGLALKTLEGALECPDLDTTVFAFGFYFFTNSSFITSIFTGSSRFRASIFLESQGWSASYSIVIRLFGLTYKHCFKTSRQASVRVFSRAGSILNLPALMASMMSWLLLPLKGRQPWSMVQRMTPVAQTSMRPSILQFLSLMKHSGAMQPKLPVSRSYCFMREMAPAMPKSMILTFFSCEFTSRTFSSLRSRWMRLFWWQYLMPFTICFKKIWAVSSLSLPSFSTTFSSSPPSRNSMMMATSMFLRVRQLCTFTMLSWLSDFRISASTKMESMSLADPMFSVFIILMAKRWPV